MQPALREANTPPSGMAEHQAVHRCPLCAEPVLARALRCKHCGQSLAGPQNGVIRAAQIVAGLETGFLILIVSSSWVLAVDAVSVGERVAMSFAAVAASILFYFLLVKRPWAFLLAGVINGITLINGLVQGSTQAAKHPLFLLIVSGALTVLPLLAWRETRRAAFLSVSR